MELGQLWVKVAKNQPLTSEELQFLEIEGRNTQLRNSFVAGNTSAQNTLDIKFPMEVIFSEVLQSALASLTIKIPADFKHLWILGGGRTTGAGISADFFLFQFSGDTGSNYINQKFYAIDTTLAGAMDTGQPTGIIGILAQGGCAAGDVSSFSTIIPIANSPSLNKNTLGLSSPAYGSLYGFASNWDSIEPITSIKLYSSADNIAAGSFISVYGLR